MIHFFGHPATLVIAVQTDKELSQNQSEALSWLLGNKPKIEQASLDAFFVGPRATMVTPWSTNATEITQNMGIEGITRMEEYRAVDEKDVSFDPMLEQFYKQLNQALFTIEREAEPVQSIEDIAAYNQEQGLALSEEEVDYLNGVSKRLGRLLTDSEVFGFSQVNSEHCRHKIFNGEFVIDGQTRPYSLFQLIKQTTQDNPNEVVSAYKDNVAFIKGPEVTQFAPTAPDRPSVYEESPFQSVLSLKAETHNFPTTVEPFNGAATGSGGEIRDRLAGGKGSLPLAGTAVYMTAYSRLEKQRAWEDNLEERPWLYQTPLDILIKASNGASDFGNKFGQPLISGSVLTFEHQEDGHQLGRKLGFDKVIMLAGGIGYGKHEQALKGKAQKDNDIVVLGGDNYRIGMGGAAVSSADTGAFDSVIELNAVQRSNPEMQKRVANAIRALVESKENPIVSIHDHGAGGHLNCLSELVEESGGKIEVSKLPVGDPTLSEKEIIGNESQERMGLLIEPKDRALLERIAERERAPFYAVGKVTGDQHFSFISSRDGQHPIDLPLSDFFGSSPKTIMEDKSIRMEYPPIPYELADFHTYLEEVLQLEAVACKDWLTNKVDRCVGGRVAKQQCAGPLQLPLNNCGVMALDFTSGHGLATSVGHSPVSGLIDPVAGSRNSIAEALSNLVWAPLEKGLAGVSLSANWMWPCRNPGEDARLYEAVEAVSDFAKELGINVPTGKDSLSMKQKYAEEEVIAPGTVIISAAAHCDNINQVIEPVLRKDGGSIYYLNLSGEEHQLGGSSFAQIRKAIGEKAPSIASGERFKQQFNAVQQMIRSGAVVAGHDIGSGGLITTLLEMCFADNQLGAQLDLTEVGESDTIKLLFSENIGLVFQLRSDQDAALLQELNIPAIRIGRPQKKEELLIKNQGVELGLMIPHMRQVWYKTSFLLDQHQTTPRLAEERYNTFHKQPLHYSFPSGFEGQLPARNTGSAKPKAAILREKGSNSEREMAHALYLAGFEVIDVHMTDLVSGREDLRSIQFLGAVGGFSNSDVLGSAKGWAGVFKYNPNAKAALKNFFEREDTLSIGICNGCQLFMELELLYPEHHEHGKMTYNDSGKHESAFTSVVVQENPSVMLSSLAGTRLGVWISHGEGKFYLPEEQNAYSLVAQYGHKGYPSNPNGSDYNTAMLCDASGRHLVTMPHIERSIFPWNWAHYPNNRSGDEVSPWLQAFINAREWCEKQ